MALFSESEPLRELMGTFHEYSEFDALELSKLVRKKDVSPVDLVDSAILAIEKLNPRLNAVVFRMFDEARHHAAKLDVNDPRGTFFGVPFLLKDLLAAYGGVPMTNGSRAFANYTPKENSELVNRFLKAGLLILGKTNTSELGLAPLAENDLFGKTRNPWNTNRTAGGSSGGSAAAVAARIVPMASGGDGGGSIRIPASCCGLFGMKPSRGRNPTGPVHNQFWEGFTVEHAITRSVRDSAALLDATHGLDAGAPYTAPPPPHSFLDAVVNPRGRFRIGMTTRATLGGSLHPDCVRATEDAAALLEELGHDVVPTEPRIEAALFRRYMLLLLAGTVAADAREAERLTGRKHATKDFETRTRMLRVLGETLTAGEYADAVRELGRIAREFSRFLEQFDVWLTPTLGAPPPPVGAYALSASEDRLARIATRMRAGRAIKWSPQTFTLADQMFDFIPFTPLANAGGQPSASVPLFWNAEGLPIGILLTGRFGDETTLFTLAAQLEQARPWRERRPLVS